MGGYGILRFGLQLTPLGAAAFFPALAALGGINVLYGGLCALRQSDVKVMIAYSSVGHMGMFFLGIGCFTASQPYAMYGLLGAQFQLFSHGVITAMLFAVAGAVYGQTHTRDLRGWGGLAAKMPIFTFFYVLAAMGSLGLPGLTGFWAEFMVLFGTWGLHHSAGGGGRSRAAVDHHVPAALGPIRILWPPQSRPPPRARRRLVGSCAPDHSGHGGTLFRSEPHSSHHPSRVGASNLSPRDVAMTASWLRTFHQMTPEAAVLLTLVWVIISDLFLPRNPRHLWIQSFIGLCGATIAAVLLFQVDTPAQALMPSIQGVFLSSPLDQCHQGGDSAAGHAVSGIRPQ
jgi:hypothetical protein